MRRACHVGLASVLSACWAGEEPLTTGARLEVEPAPLVAGSPLTVTAFGLPSRGPETQDDGISLGGRSLDITSWGARKIEAVVPADIPRGFAPLVVVVDGRPWASQLVETLSEVAPPDAAVAPRDATAERDVAALDAEAPRRFSVDVVADPSPAQGFFLASRDAGPDEVLLEARGTPSNGAWGVAFHAVWEPLQLEFISAEVPPEHVQAVARAVKPGRLVFGAVIGSSDVPLVTLRFRVVARGERRVSLPTAFAEARDERNQRRPDLTFAGVTVTTRVAVPGGAQP